MSNNINVTTEVFRAFINKVIARQRCEFVDTLSRIALKIPRTKYLH